MTKAENIRRAAPVLVALVEELRERKAREAEQAREDERRAS